jgi:hypothetical protein
LGLNYGSYWISLPLPQASTCYSEISIMRTFLLIICLLIIVPLVALMVVSSTPVLTMPATVTALGKSTPITVQVSDPHGIRSAVATVEQNGPVS